MIRLLVCFLTIISLSTSAFAKVIGFDDRQILKDAPCAATPATMARVLVPTDGKMALSTGFAAEVENGAKFFITGAQAFYFKGELRAPIDEVEVDVLVELAPGECRYQKVGISRFAVGSTSPRQTFHGVARDLAVFQIDDAEVASKVRPIKVGAGICRKPETALFAYAWSVGQGILPVRSECKIQSKPAVSEYDDISFLHHDCDTSGGSYGGLMLCDPTDLNPELRGVHVTAWGTDGRQFGDGVYNIALPVDFRTIRALLRAMEKYGD